MLCDSIPFCIWRSATHPAPVIDLALFKVRAFALANVASLLFGTAFFALLLGNVLFLATAWHYSILQAGFAFTPAPICSAIVAGPGARQFGAVLGVAILVAILGSPTQHTVMNAFHHAWTFCLGMTLAAGIACLALGRTTARAVLSAARPEMRDTVPVLERPA